MNDSVYVPGSRINGSVIGDSPTSLPAIWICVPSGFTVNITVPTFVDTSSNFVCAFFTSFGSLTMPPSAGVSPLPDPDPDPITAADPASEPVFGGVGVGGLADPDPAAEPLAEPVLDGAGGFAEPDPDPDPDPTGSGSI